MPCIMAGMCEMDSSSPVVDYGSGKCLAGLAGYDALHVMFPSDVDRPRMLCIMADVDQKDRYSGMHKACIACDSAPRAVFLPFVRPKMLRIMAGTHRKDICPRRTGKLDYLGDDVVFFYGLLFLEVTCSSCLPEEHRVHSFSGDDSRNGLRFQHSSWFNSGYMFGISLRGFLGEFHAFLREGRTLGS